MNRLPWRLDPLDVTTYAYVNMDRLATRVDLLMRSESYQYDLAGDMTPLMDRKSKATKVWEADKYFTGCRC